MPREESRLEQLIAFQIEACGLGPPEREYPFKVGKVTYHFDFAFPEAKVAVECEGGTWVGGSHTRGKRYASDVAKYNEAGLAGWLVLRCTTDMCQLSDARAINYIARALTGRGVTRNAVVGRDPDRARQSGETADEE